MRESGAILSGADVTETVTRCQKPLRAVEFVMEK